LETSQHWNEEKIGSSLLGLVGIAILYGVLQIGKKNKEWPQLE
jgi:hypothetical protein